MKAPGSLHFPGPHHHRAPLVGWWPSASLLAVAVFQPPFFLLLPPCPFCLPFCKTPFSSLWHSLPFHQTFSTLLPLFTLWGEATHGAGGWSGKERERERVGRKGKERKGKERKGRRGGMDKKKDGKRMEERERAVKGETRRDQPIVDGRCVACGLPPQLEAHGAPWDLHSFAVKQLVAFFLYFSFYFFIFFSFSRVNHFPVFFFCCCCDDLCVGILSLNRFFFFGVGKFDLLTKLV